MFVSEKSTQLAAIIYIIFSLYPPGSTTSLPVLKELALSLKMGYWILSSLNMLHWIIANTGVDPCIQEQGLCTAFTVASLGDLEGSEPMYRESSGRIKSKEAANTWHWQVRESTLGAISILCLKVKGHRYGFSHQIPHYGHIKHVVINHNDTKARH